MATGIQAAGAEVMLDRLVEAFPWVKRHIGDPGASAANPAADTTRANSTGLWAAADGDTVTTDTDVPFGEATATETYTHVTGWSTVTGGACGWSGVVTDGAVTAGTDVVIPAGDITVTQTLAS